jgi:hypothetical protein
MNAEESPWVSRFPSALSDSAIDRRIKIPAVPLDDLGKGTPQVDSALLAAGLKKVFVPTAALRRHLRRLIGQGRAHALMCFRDAKQFGSNVYAPTPIGWDGMAICLTGLAGVGKTELLRALGRLLGEPIVTSIPNLDGLLVVSSWTRSLREAKTLPELYMPYVMEEGDCPKSQVESSMDKVRRMSTPKLLKAARRRAYRDGVSLIVLDEFQFATLSEGANTRATDILLQSSVLGPCLIYSANFSMVHRLMQRNQEDQQRLLADPIVVTPEIPGNDWNVTCEEKFKVAPGVFSIDVKKDGETLQHYSYGIRRLADLLLVIAYREGRENKRTVVKIEDVEAAYKSTAFTTARKEVEFLIGQSAASKREKRTRLDLCCPFDLPPRELNAPESSQPTESDKETREQLLMASLTPQQRAVLDGLGNRNDSETAASRRPRMPKVTKAALLAGGVAARAMTPG